MQSMNVRTRWLFLLLALTVGCNTKSSGPTSGSNQDEGLPMPTADGSKPKKDIVPIKRDVKTMEGNWVVVVTLQLSDQYRWIIKLTKGTDGAYLGEFLDTSNDNQTEGKPEVVSTEVNGNDIKLSFKDSKGEFDFIGTFDQGFIRGTIRSSPSEVFLTRLLPTDEKSLERFEPTGLPPGSDVFRSLVEGKDTKAEDLLAAVAALRYVIWNTF